jgi:hypothetical protein
MSPGLTTVFGAQERIHARADSAATIHDPTAGQCHRKLHPSPRFHLRQASLAVVWQKKQIKHSTSLHFSSLPRGGSLGQKAQWTRKIKAKAQKTRQSTASADQSARVGIVGSSALVVRLSFEGMNQRGRMLTCKARGGL